MRNIKCSDCAEYRNEWCEKIVDSPYPDMLRDCQYWHERKDMVEVIRCKNCKFWQDQEEGVIEVPICARPENKYEKLPFRFMIGKDGFCSFGERRSE